MPKVQLLKLAAIIYVISYFSSVPAIPAAPAARKAVSAVSITGASPVDPSIDRSPVAKITLLQVNDVYQEMPVDKGTRGGLARLSTLKNEIIAKQPHTLFLFAGDTISPSIASLTFKGKQMIACWNALGIDVAVFGNHEFDFGPDVLRERINESKFTWVCANVIDKATGKTFAGIQPYVIKDVDGIKVGILGLLTPDTVRTSKTGPGIAVLDPVTTAKKYVPEMRAKGAQIIVALTHLNMAVDKDVAWCAKVDAIIGGHEHIVMQALANGTPIVKSGSDARNLGRTDINYDPVKHRISSIDWEILPVTDKIKADPQLEQLIKTFENQLSKELDESIGETQIELDATQAANQTRETNLADFIADAYRDQTGADIAIYNGGSIRANALFGPGKLTRRDIMSILPFENPIVKMTVSGATVRAALENGVSQIGIKAGGRFPQVSGLTYSFDPTRPPGQKVVDVMIGSQPLSDDKEYSLATSEFVAEGGDGYDMLKDQKMLINAESGNVESTVLLSAISKSKAICPKVDGRIKRLDKAER